MFGILQSIIRVSEFSIGNISSGYRSFNIINSILEFTGVNAAKIRWLTTLGISRAAT